MKDSKNNKNQLEWENYIKDAKSDISMDVEPFWKKYVNKPFTWNNYIGYRKYYYFEYVETEWGKYLKKHLEYPKTNFTDFLIVQFRLSSHEQADFFIRIWITIKYKIFQ